MSIQARPLLILAGLLVLGGLLWYFSSILVYLIAAAILALIGRPLMNLLGRIRIRKWMLPSALRAVITLALLYGAVGINFAILVPTVLAQINQVKNLDAAAIEQGLQAPISQAEALLRQYGLADTVQVEQYIQERVVSIVSEINVTRILNGIAGVTGDFLVGLSSITFIAFFFLKERNLFSRIVLTATPDAHIEKIKNVMQHSQGLLQRYFLGVLGETLLVGALISLALWMLGIDNAVLIGVFGGLLNIIPYLGPLLGAALGVSLTLLGHLHLDYATELLPMAGQVAVVFLSVQAIDNFLLQPLIFSNSVNAHPLEIFLVILMAGMAGGVAGMIAAVPGYTVLRVVAREFFSEFKIVQTMTREL
ncbi:MAG: AI-2E family transporter [Bacteroidia bacterium]|nr:AI-2E family transporter [Bacteroidia bacterium]